jgi:trigger factor
MTSFPADPEVDDESTAGEESESKQRLDLTVTVDSPGACQRHVTVQVPRADVDRYFSNALAEMMPSASVPGFRQGRAPRKLVETHFRKELKEQIKGSILYDSLTQVTEDQKFATISEPDFDIESVVLPDDGPMTFEFDIEVRPEFDVPDWKGLSLERPVHEFTAKDLEERLTEVLDSLADCLPTGAPVAPGDTVVISFDFRRAGERISSTDEVTLVVRKNVSFHDGTLFDFDKLIVGAKIGEEREGKIEIAEDCAREELRGETLQVRVTIHEIMRVHPPELSSDLLKQLGSFDSIGELHDAIRNQLQRQLQYHQSQRIRKQISKMLADASKWELPPNLLRRQSERELERAIMELKSSGFSETQIRAHSNLLRQNSQEATATALREHFVLEKIAEQEGIEASERDFDEEILQMALQSNESPRSIRARIDKRGLIDILRNQIIERKVIDLIQSHARFKDVPYEPSRPTTSAVDFAIGREEEAAIPVAKHGGEQLELPRPVDRT